MGWMDGWMDDACLWGELGERWNDASAGSWVRGMRNGMGGGESSLYITK